MIPSRLNEIKLPITQKPLYNAQALFSTLACGYQKQFYLLEVRLFLQKISFASRNLENKALF